MKLTQAYTDADFIEIEKSPDRRKAYFWQKAQRLILSSDAWEKDLGEFILKNLEDLAKICEVGP